MKTVFGLLLALGILFLLLQPLSIALGYVVVLVWIAYLLRVIFYENDALTNQLDQFEYPDSS